MSCTYIIWYVMRICHYNIAIPLGHIVMTYNYDICLNMSWTYIIRYVMGICPVGHVENGWCFNDICVRHIHMTYLNDMQGTLRNDISNDISNFDMSCRRHDSKYVLTCNDTCNDICSWRILMTGPRMTYLMTYVFIRHRQDIYRLYTVKGVKWTTTICHGICH